MGCCWVASFYKIQLLNHYLQKIWKCWNLILERTENHGSVWTRMAKPYSMFAVSHHQLQLNLLPADQIHISGCLSGRAEMQYVPIHPRMLNLSWKSKILIWITLLIVITRERNKFETPRCISQETKVLKFCGLKHTGL